MIVADFNLHALFGDLPDITVTKVTRPPKRFEHLQMHKATKAVREKVQQLSLINGHKIAKLERD
jgi:hypothetical protein